ncbi:precorrin-6B methylase [Limnothrix sp. PR1529]|uniref:precorrin-6Y C5,15-methyltransferase subunit CbiT n=1 Tax=Limnothrix sp. PR1529 TaxID=1704291 RepID=UPI00081D51AF|nr:precorrin-6Y C5,15-methyltransferase subunit CbiT [Limnothrix sp. PR1529]OCQ95133.1 precorrin-6Y C5,15-methyltransferase (decarboxylating) subunit CbiT [Limnothrix sp. P13C2]PIB14698.1 precorrin-6B methylase [Limnothrix sp. PR1529]
MTTPLWPYVTPGIPDDLFERLPGIPMTKRETRLAILSMLRLSANSVLWDIGAGTGTISVEAALMIPQGRVVAIERDPDVVQLIRTNCDRFGVKNVRVVEGSAPDCFGLLKQPPDRVCIGGGRPLKDLLETAWERLPLGGRVVALSTSLEGLYALSEALAEVQALNIEVVQAAGNRLERRANSQVLAAIDPLFILCGEKGEG